MGGGGVGFDPSHCSRNIHPILGSPREVSTDVNLL